MYVLLNLFTQHPNVAGCSHSPNVIPPLHFLSCSVSFSFDYVMLFRSNSQHIRTPYSELECYKCKSIHKKLLPLLLSLIHTHTLSSQLSCGDNFVSFLTVIHTNFVNCATLFNASAFSRNFREYIMKTIIHTMYEILFIVRL